MKRMGLLMVMMALAAVGLVHAAGMVLERDVGQGRLVEAVAFENGDSVVVSIADLPRVGIRAFNFAYEGDGVYEQAWSNSFPYDRDPDRVFVAVCGGWLQVHAGWDDDSNPMVRKFRWELPRKVRRVALPIVCR